MRKKQRIPKMRDGIQRGQPWKPPAYAKHFRNVGWLGRTWGGCDKTSSVGSFGGGSGS